jgi:hypothetical protein
MVSAPSLVVTVALTVSTMSVATTSTTVTVEIVAVTAPLALVIVSTVAGTPVSVDFPSPDIVIDSKDAALVSVSEFDPLISTANDVLVAVIAKVPVVPEILRAFAPVTVKDPEDPLE